MKASLEQVKKWEMLFNKNDISIINTYANDGILIGTFAIKIKIFFICFGINFGIQNYIYVLNINI
jgi:hypothetical protein